MKNFSLHSTINTLFKGLLALIACLAVGQPAVQAALPPAMPNAGVGVWLDDHTFYEGVMYDIYDYELYAHLSTPVSYIVKVDVTLQPGTATSKVDYFFMTWNETDTYTVEFYPGQTSVPIEVDIVSDEVAEEGPEYFFLNLSNSVGAAIIDPVSMITIEDDDISQDLWAVPFNSAVSNPEVGVTDMQINAANEIYVSYYGWERYGNEAVDSTLVKFNAQGMQLWKVSIPMEHVEDIVLDPAGNVITAGNYHTEYGVIRKYSPGGMLLWSRSYTVSTKDFSTYEDIITDAGSNVYVAGYGPPAGSKGSQLVVEKYAPDGTLLWTRQVGTANRLERGHAIGLDAFGNVYVLGGFYIDPSPYYLLVKYNPDGTELWERSSPFGTMEAYMSNQPRLAINNFGVSYLGLTYRTYCSQDGSYRSKDKLVVYTADGTLQYESPQYEGCVPNSDVMQLIAQKNGNAVVVKSGGVLEEVTPFGDSVWNAFGGYGTNGTYAWISDNGWQYTSGSVNPFTRAITVSSFNPTHCRLWTQHYTPPLTAEAASWEQSGMLAPNDGSEHFSYVGADSTGAVYATTQEGGTGWLVKFAPYVPTPKIKIGDAMVRESETGGVSVNVPIVLTGPSNSDTTFFYQTVNGSAYSGLDYENSTGLVTIPANSLSAEINIPVNSDDLTEVPEFFYVYLYDPSTNGFFETSLAKVTIWDSETPGWLYLPLMIR